MKQLNIGDLVVINEKGKNGRFSHLYTPNIGKVVERYIDKLYTIDFGLTYITSDGTEKPNCYFMYPDEVDTVFTV